MKKIFLLIPAASVLVLGGCGSKPEPVPTPETAIPMHLSIPVSQTKVTDTAYEIGDVAGLYVVTDGTPLSADANHVNNESLSFNGGEWSTPEALYWKDQRTPESFYVYYPRLNSVSDPEAIPVSVKADQSTLAGYKASEVLWGKRESVSPTASVVEISSTHRMSKLLIYIKPGNGYTEESLRSESISVTINSLQLTGSLRMSNGEITANGSPADITPYQEGDHYRALIIPQQIDGQTLISLKVGEYSFSHQSSITFKSNTQHTVTLTVNKVSEGINIGIGDWETDSEDYGGTVN